MGDHLDQLALELLESKKYTGTFQSRAQQGWAFANGVPFAHAWGKNTKGDYGGLPQHVKKDKTKEEDVDEAWAQSTMGALNRGSHHPMVARLHRKIKVHPRSHMSEDELEEFVSTKVRKRSQTLPGGRYPMPDKKHARLALQMINRGSLSPEEKAKVRARAHKMLGKSKTQEADRGKDGKLVSGAHSAQAREHMLAASIAMNSGDHDEAVRRLESAQIYTSHSPHAKADVALGHLKDAGVLLRNGNSEKASAKVDKAYGVLQGEPNHLLKMKQSRESAAAQRSTFLETLTFHPRFLENSYNAAKGTVDVIIVTEGMGNARDKHFYTREAIADAVKSKVFESAQAYADHPSKFDDDNRPERSVRDLIGYYYGSKLTEVQDKKTGQPVKAYAATFKIQSGLDWVNGIVREAIDFNKRFPDKTYVGISINADGDTVPTSLDGIDVNKVVKITEAFSADMVTKPARGGGFLRLVEGAGGAHTQQGAGMAGILEAAARLEKLAEGEEVDPAELKKLASQIREAKSDDDDDKLEEKDGDADDLSKKGSSKNKVGLDQMKEEGNNTNDGDADGDDDFTTKKSREAVKSDDDNDGDVDDDPQEDTEDQPMFGKKGGRKVGESAKRESAKRESAKRESGRTRSRGNLTEASVADLKKKFPSLYAAALKEAQTTLRSDDATLRREVNELRAEKALRETVASATRLLRESAIPEGGYKRMLQQLIGLTEDEQVETIRGEEQYLESIGVVGGKRIGGNGERGNNNLREGDVASNTSAVLVGLTEE